MRILDNTFFLNGSGNIMLISYYLPETVLTNDELSALYPNWSSQKIYDKTGAKARHISGENETALDMAEKAAKQLFAEYHIDPTEIDFVILSTMSPDYVLPTSACLLQDRLGIPKSAGAFDLTLGCSAFAYVLATASSLIKTGLAKKVLVVSSETLSKYIHPLDKSVRTLFGDAAAAVLLDQNDAAHVGAFVFGTDGSGAKNLIVPIGGQRHPYHAEESYPEITDASGNVRTKCNLFMDGPEIFNFAVKAVTASFQEVLKKNNLQKEDIDLFVFHQASKFILDFLRTFLKIPEEKFYINMEDCGNTVSASVPIALARAEKEGKLQKGNRVMTICFGVGYSWSASVFTW